jgi:hypothetical protein
MVNATFYCPSPLVYAYDDHDTVLWAFEPGHCAVPCPTITYTSNEWDFLKQAVWILAVISLITTTMTLTILSADISKLFLRAMFILGFLVISITSVIFLAENADDGVVCNGDGHYVKKAPLCIFQAIVTIFILLWVEIWSVILSVDTYMHIVSRTSMERMSYWRKRYMGIALTFCTVLTIIPIIGDNVGFDPKANLPFCLYLYSENKWYFWSTLYAPFITLNSVCFIITILGAKRIHQIFVTTSKYTIKDSVSSSSAAAAVASSSTRTRSRTKGLTSSSGARENNNSSSHGNSSLREDSSHSPQVVRRYGDDPDEEGDEEEGGYDYDDGSSVDSHELTENYRSHLPAGALSLNPEFYEGSMVAKETSSPVTSVDYGAPPVSLFPRLQHSTSSAGTKNPLNAPLTPDDHHILCSPPGDDERWRDSEAKWFKSYHEPSFQGTRPTLTHLVSTTQDYRSSEVFSLTSGGGQTPFSDRTVSRDTESTWAGNIAHSLKKSSVSVNLNLLKEALRYNGRSILFVIVFCLTTLYVAPSLLYINGIKYNDYVTGTEDYVACLVEAAFLCHVKTQEGVDQCAKEECGRFPGDRLDVGERAGKLQFFSTMIWMFGYGIVPSFIFGFSSTLIRKFIDRSNGAVDSFVCCQMASLKTATTSSSSATTTTTDQQVANKS